MWSMSEKECERESVCVRERERERVCERGCMVVMCSKGSPSYSTGTKWPADFKRGRKSLADEPWRGRRICETNTNCYFGWDIKRGGWGTISQLTKFQWNLEFLNIVFNIIHERSSVSKVSARWVGQNLSTQDRHQVTSRHMLLEPFNANPSD